MNNEEVEMWLELCMYKLLLGFCFYFTFALLCIYGLLWKDRHKVIIHRTTKLMAISTHQIYVLKNQYCAIINILK